MCGTWQGGVAKPFLSPFQKQMLPAVWSRDTDRGVPHVKIRSTGLETGEVGEESRMQEYRFTGPTTGTDSRDTSKISPSLTTDSPKLKHVQIVFRRGCLHYTDFNKKIQHF